MTRERKAVLNIVILNKIQECLHFTFYFTVLILRSQFHKIRFSYFFLHDVVILVHPRHFLSKKKGHERSYLQRSACTAPEFSFLGESVRVVERKLSTMCSIGSD